MTALNGLYLLRAWRVNPEAVTSGYALRRFTPLHDRSATAKMLLSILTGCSGQSEAKVLQLRSHLRVRKLCLWLMERSR